MYFSIKEVARLQNMHESSIRNWIKRGIFPNAFVGKSNKWYIPEEDIEKLKGTDVRIIEMKNKLVGLNYGDLTIIDVLYYRKEGDNNRLCVNALCGCGNIVEKLYYTIKRGSIKSCGNNCILKSNFNIGDRYGFLTVIGDEGIHAFGVNKRRFVKAKCECSNTITIPLVKLKSNQYRSCGKKCRMWLKDIVGNKYGLLTVIKELNKKNKQRYFLCRCECNEVREKSYYKLISGRTKYCSYGCVLKRGERHHAWKSYIPLEEREKGRNYWEYEQWQKKVKIRDKFTCQNTNCRQVGGNLQSHHLNSYDWYNEGRTDLTNGVTLCKKCHTDFHRIYGYGMNTKDQYYEWLYNNVNTTF
ncbi:helix-turn-helix domain-containing protein [Robertmurraya sp. P23]|uniref:helix-turn-helix domain-containing protein n=1 Tax=Robertmurraya sp. P23 TaxID=3436931 RepID=UPI003D990559